MKNVGHKKAFERGSIGHFSAMKNINIPKDPLDRPATSILTSQRKILPEINTSGTFWGSWTHPVSPILWLLDKRLSTNSDSVYKEITRNSSRMFISFSFCLHPHFSVSTIFLLFSSFNRNAAKVLLPSSFQRTSPANFVTIRQLQLLTPTTSPKPKTAQNSARRRALPGFARTYD